MKNSECKALSIPKGIVFGTLYLPTIQNACSSEGTPGKILVQLYLPTIQNACSSLDKYYSV